MAIIERNGRYQVRAYERGTGRRPTIGTFDDRETAEAAERAANEPRMRTAFSGVPTRFDGLADEWLRLRSTNLAPATLDDYRMCVNRLKRLLGNKRLSDLTARDVQLAQAEMSRTLSSNTVNRHETRLRAVLNYGVAIGALRRNPAMDIKKVPVRALRDPRVLTAREVHALLAEIPDYYKPFILVMLLCGLRLGEALGVRVSDVNWLDGTIHVEYQVNDRRQHTRLKTPRSRRIVPVPSRLLEVLRAHRQRWPHDGELLFVNSEGKLIDRASFRRRVFNKAKRAAGLVGHNRSLVMHDLRHTYGSTLIRAGVDIQTVSDLMGHRDATVTLRRYAHEMPKDHAALGATIQSAFRLDSGAE